MKTYEIEGTIEAEEVREENGNMVFYADGKPVARFITCYSFSEL